MFCCIFDNDFILDYSVVLAQLWVALLPQYVHPLRRHPCLPWLSAAPQVILIVQKIILRDLFSCVSEY